jgi:peptide chain release factor 2
LLADPKVWNQPEQMQHLSKERTGLQRVVLLIDTLDAGLNETKELLALAGTEKDESVINGVVQDLKRYEKEVHQLEFKRMFSGELDASNAYLDIQSGSGGDEAQDWANMLLRMYLRWGEQHGFETELLEASPGEIAGIKSATIKFTGDYAYGWLRTETGVHRLVRRSPFSATNKRHTSFASVFVSPEVDESITVDINPADLRIDTYRAGGAGGQHVNRTDSAVRITHMPTNTVVQCQSERSQHQNKAQAMKQLKAKLYKLELKKRQAAQQALEESKTAIGWGNQIRSYVLDESRVKDLRTGVETRNPKSVLDGDLNQFIEASLLQGIE